MGNLRLLLAVMAASVFSALITALVMGRGDESTPPSAVDSGHEFTLLTATLADFVRTMQSLQPVSASPAGQNVNPEPLPRTSIGESAALHAIARHLEELKEFVGAQFQRGSWTGSNSSSGELATMRTQYADTQWQALTELRQRFSADRGATSQSLLLLTPAVILQRYGMPTQIQTTDRGEVVWNYTKRQPGEARLNVTFRFLDGYVISAN